MENIWKKTRAFFSPNQFQMKLQNKTYEKTKKKDDANVSSTFLVEIGKIRQVTNITRSNLDKSLMFST